MCSIDYLERGFGCLTKSGTVNLKLFLLGLLSSFFGVDLVDTFLREKDYGYNESVRSDGVIVAWKAGQLYILYSFSGIGCACLGYSFTKIF